EVLELLRKKAQQEGEEAPDPRDRIDYIDWLYQNKIAPKLEAQDAEIVPGVEGQDLRGGAVRDERGAGGKTGETRCWTKRRFFFRVAAAAARFASWRFVISEIRAGHRSILRI